MLRFNDLLSLTLYTGHSLLYGFLCFNGKFVQIHIPFVLSLRKRLTQKSCKILYIRQIGIKADILSHGAVLYILHREGNPLPR